MREFLAPMRANPTIGQRADGERVMVRIKSKILSLLRSFVDFQRTLARKLFDSYRPEQHYMRGPGPRWHQKRNAPHA
jgi:hypothetical protein